MTLDIQAMLEQAGLAGLQTLRHDRVIPNPDNPRRDFDEAELQALAASIVERGLLQPITVFPADSSGRHVIRFGERRWRAVGMAGLPTISGIISEPAAGAVQLIDQVIENDQRVGLSAIEMSQAIKLLGDAGMTKAAIAAQLGRSPAMISLYAAVIEMPAPLQMLGDSVSIRTLHDLYRLWRRQPQAVTDFIEATAADAIDRRRVQDLAARFEPSATVSAASSGAKRPVAASPLSAPRMRAPERLPIAPDAFDHGYARVRCPAGEGLLLFPTGSSGEKLLIRLDGRSEPVEAEPDTVMILAVRAESFQVP